MSLPNLCLFTLLAAVVAFPAVRRLEVEIRQSGTRAQSGKSCVDAI